MSSVRSPRASGRSGEQPLDDIDQRLAKNI
jgi:hypothetical protein